MKTVLLFSWTLLTACSFHLRSDYDVPQALQQLSLTSYDQYSQFTRLLKNQLRQNDIVLVPPAEDVPNLHILSESTGTKTLSIYQNTRAAEKQISLTIKYRVIIPNQSANEFSTSVSRSYLDNPLTALAKSVEKTMIIGEMRQRAASQVIRQLARLKSLNLPKTHVQRLPAAPASASPAAIQTNSTTIQTSPASVQSDAPQATSE